MGAARFPQQHHQHLHPQPRECACHHQGGHHPQHLRTHAEVKSYAPSESPDHTFQYIMTSPPTPTCTPQDQPAPRELRASLPPARCTSFFRRFLPAPPDEVCRPATGHAFHRTMHAPEINCAYLQQPQPTNLPSPLTQTLTLVHDVQRLAITLVRLVVCVVNLSIRETAVAALIRHRATRGLRC